MTLMLFPQHREIRQLEMLNVFMGFEQANRYAIMSPEGEHVG